jgi:hypothetical protein
MGNDPSNQAFWDEHHHLCLFPYYPKDSPLKNQNTELIWKFKRNESSAVHIVTQMAVQAFTQNERILQAIRPFWYLVVMPPHEAGKHNLPCEILCARLALNFPSWLHSLPNALERAGDVEKSSMAKHEGKKRPDFLDHATSISYEGPQEICTENDGILLVDDVFTTGNTFEACYGILKDATSCESIIGFFVGKTIR